MSSKVLRKKRAVLWAKQDGRCCYCQVALKPVPAKKSRKPLHPATETLEHLRRKVDGGTHRNDNIALACLECNTGRGSMDWLSYTTYRRGEFLEAAE